MLITPCFDKGLVTVGLRTTQAVVKMRRRNGYAKAFCIAAQKMQQAHGVGSAGHGAQHMRPPREHSVLIYKISNRLH